MPVVGGVLSAILLTFVAVRARKRRLAWAAVLDHVARTFRGKYREAGASTAKEEADLDPYRLVVDERKETSLVGGEQDSSRRYMRVTLSRSRDKPVYLGPPRAAKGSTKDYGAHANSGPSTLTVAGRALEVEGVSPKLRAALEQDQELQTMLLRAIDAGGFVRNGRVILETETFEHDPEAMVRRIHELRALADKVV